MSKKIFRGKVVSDKMQKTVVVSVEIPKLHPMYGKKVKNTKKFMARNEIEAKMGDEVVIQESRPYSKNVTWIVTEVAGQKEEKSKKSTKVKKDVSEDK